MLVASGGLRALACLVSLLLPCACYVPEPATAPPRSNGTVGGDGGATACSCFFGEWSVWTACGNRCLGDAKLSCSASTASVDPTGCAFRAPDGGRAATDAGVIVEEVFVDAGSDAGSACPAPSSSCGCTVYPYQSDSFGVTIPCCASLCVESVKDRAWSCSEDGQTTVSSAAVCRR